MSICSYDRLRQAAAAPRVTGCVYLYCESKRRIEKGNSVVPDGEEGFHPGNFIPLRKWPSLERKIYFTALE